MKKIDLERNELIYNLYFKDKLTVSEISQKVNLSISQISRILSKSALYQQEKANRKEENHKKHNEQAKEIMKKKEIKNEWKKKQLWIDYIDKLQWNSLILIPYLKLLLEKIVQVLIVIIQKEKDLN